MVASQKEEVFRVFDLICQKEANDFEVLLTTINIITQKQVVRLWWEISNLKNSKQVNKLTMDVTGDDERWIQFYQVWLSYKYLLRFLNEHLDLLLCKIDRLNSKVRSIRLDVVSHFQESINNGVQLIMIDTRLRRIRISRRLLCCLVWRIRRASTFKLICTHSYIVFHLFLF